MRPLFINFQVDVPVQVCQFQIREYRLFIYLIKVKKEFWKNTHVHKATQ